MPLTRCARIFKSLGPAVLALGLAFPFFTARAEIVVIATSYNNGVNGSDVVTPTTPVAQQFTLNQLSTITSVDVSLTQQFQGISLSNTSLSILSDSSNTPGAVLATDTGESGSTGFGFGDISYTFGSVSLGAGVYWLELGYSGSPDGPSWQLQSAGQNNTSSTGNIDNLLYDGGASTGTLLTRINGTVAASPEPGSLALALGGILAVWAARRIGFSKG